MDDNLLESANYLLSTPDKDDCFFLLKSKDGSEEKVGFKKQIVLAFSEPLRKSAEKSPLATPEEIVLRGVKSETLKNLDNVPVRRSGNHSMKFVNRRNCEFDGFGGNVLDNGFETESCVQYFGST